MKLCYVSRPRNPFFAISFGIVFPLMASASTATWLGGTGNWTDSANWSVGVIPTNTEDTVYDIVIDGDPQTDSAVAMTLPGYVTVASAVLDEGDTLTLTGKAGNQGTTSSGMTFSELRNSGLFTMQGGSASKSHGNNFDLRFSGPTNAPFNTASGTLVFKSISNYRRCHNYVHLPSVSQNDGLFTAETRMTQDAGHATIQINAVDGVAKYINNGTTILYGKGDGNAWMTLSPATANSAFSLEGTGTVWLASATGTGTNNYKARSMVAAIQTGVTFTHAARHTIVGCGNIGHSGGNISNGQGKLTCQNFSKVVNEGTILAQRYAGASDGLTSSISNLVITAGSGIVSNAPSGKIVAGTPVSVASLQIGSGSGTFINAGLLEIAAGSTCSNACATTLAESSVFRFGIDASVMTVEAFEEWLSQRPDPSEVEPGEGGEEGGEEPAEEPEPEPDPVLKGILDVTGTLVLGGRIELAEGSRPVINGTYRIATLPPNAVSGPLPSVVRTGSQPGFTLILNAENGTLDAFFPAPETLILVR